MKLITSNIRLLLAALFCMTILSAWIPSVEAGDDVMIEDPEPEQSADTNQPWYKEPFDKYAHDGYLSFYNNHTHERVAVNYLNDDHTFDILALQKVNYILRSYSDNIVIDMNRDLVVLLDRIQDHFGSDTVIEIVSGYRSPEYNSSLRARGRGVAKHSYHMRGMACDIRLEGVSTRELYTYVLSLQAGGAGIYSRTGFVHVDVGPLRTWGS